MNVHLSSQTELGMPILTLKGQARLLDVTIYATSPFDPMIKEIDNVD